MRRLPPAPVLAALFLLLSLAAPPAPVLAGDEGQTLYLEPLAVNATRIVTPTMQAGDAVYTGTRVTEKGLELQGARAETSVYNALNVVPGVNVESVDSFGLAPEQGTIRTRGVRGYLGSLSVAGVPNWGGNPIGPREYLYDTNNFEGVTVYKGVVPADIGTGVGARGGAIELHPRWPSLEPGAQIEQAAGSDSFTRTFLRLDSGSLTPTDTRLSASFSRSEADKWKGPGDAGPRTNVNLMLVQPTGDTDDIKVFFNSNSIDFDQYRKLSYAETQSLSSTYRSDYNPRLTGKRAEDIYYYDYNRSRFNNQDLLSVVTAGVGESTQVRFKPYYSREDSTVYNGATSNGGVVQQRTRDVERYGLIAESETEFDAVKTVVGTLFESNDMQITTKNYVPGSMNFLGYGVYTRNLDNGQLHTPYAKVSGEWDRFKWQAGLKYFFYRDPATHGYTSTAAAPNSLRRAGDLDRETKEYQALLPTAGLSYRIGEGAEAFADYGRSQIRPYSYVPLINTYNANRAKFQAAGVTLDDMFQGYDMEITDTVEAGVRLDLGRLELTPTLYATRSENLLVTVYDPRVNLSYQQNKGDATGYGAELEATLRLDERFTVFLSPSYNILTYDHDLTYQGATLDCKGRQVVDTPEVMAKAGVLFTWKDLAVSPFLRYVGERYGDARHKEKVDGYTVLDLKADYTIPDILHAKALVLSLEASNLLGEKYVSSITASDDSRDGERSSLVGAPFSVLLSAALRF